MADRRRASKFTLEQVIEAAMNHDDEEDIEEGSNDDENIAGDCEDEDGAPINVTLSNLVPTFVPDLETEQVCLLMAI